MPPPNEDPLVTSARHEAIVAIVVWGVATLWSVGYCALYGYNRAPESLTFILWFPDWIFWGVIVPWFACLAVSVWFAMFYMQDGDLGVAADTDTTDDPHLSPPAHRAQQESGNV